MAISREIVGPARSMFWSGEGKMAEWFMGWLIQYCKVVWGSGKTLLLHV